MKILCGLLGAIVGAVSCLIAALCVAFASSAALGGNTLLAGFLAVFLVPIGLATGGILGTIAGCRLWSRVTGKLADAPLRAKVWHIGRVLATVVLLDTAMGYIIVHCDDPPPDRVLLAHFERNQPAFDQIVQMLRKDKGLTRVDDNWYADAKDSHGGGHSEETTPRIEEYRRRLRAVGTPRGFSTDEHHREVRFLYWLVGSAMSSDKTKGYAYEETPPTPLLPTLDGYRPTRSRIRVYRHIRGNWYLFYEYISG